MANGVSESARRWWTDVLVERLENRGDLSWRPRIDLDQRCFYGAPMGAASQELTSGGEDIEAALTDYCRDWAIRTNLPTVWEVLLQLSKAQLHDEHVRILMEFAHSDSQEKRKRGYRLVSLVLFFEWLLVPDRTGPNKGSRWHHLENASGAKRYYNSRLLEGYCLAADRVRALLGISETHALACKPEFAGVWSWIGVPPIAAEILVRLLRRTKAHSLDCAQRGKDTLDAISLARQTGTPVGVSPKGIREKDVSTKKLLKPFELAMATELYLFSNVTDLSAKTASPRPLHAGGDMSQKPGPDAAQRAQRLGLDHLLNYVISGSRYAVDGIKDIDKGLKAFVANAVVDWVDGHPRIRVEWTNPMSGEPDPDDFEVVVHTEATVDGHKTADALFAVVDEVEWLPEKVCWLLTIYPLFGRFSVLYRLVDSRKPIVKVKLADAVPQTEDSPFVIGVAVSLGALAKSPEAPDLDGAAQFPPGRG